MKGVYLTDIDIENASGYDKKILGQIDGFKKNGYTMHLISLFNSKFNSEEVTTDFIIFGNSSIEINIKPLFKQIAFFKNAFLKICKINPDFIYIRYPRCNPVFLMFLKKLRIFKHKLVIFHEIPTYPYDNEEREGLSSKILFLVDVITRKKLKRYIDRIVAVSYYDDIFNISTIAIENGVSVDNFKKISIKKNQQNLELIFVGNCAHWHGLDRLIHGIINYKRSNNKINFVLHIVGPINDYIKKLINIAKESNIIDHVKFHGELYNADLDAIYDKCDIGIGTLGFHRTNIESLSVLKVREYIARGLPFIYSGSDKSIDKSFEFALQLPNNDSSIEIEDILTFYSKVTKHGDYTNPIRKYAKDNIDWNIMLKPVVNELIKIKQR